MPPLQLSMRHGLALDEARDRLARVADDARALFGCLVVGTGWQADREAALIDGIGFSVEIRVDSEEVHASGELNPFWTERLSALLEKAFLP
jgi:hypothetical protein